MTGKGERKEEEGEESEPLNIPVKGGGEVRRWSDVCFVFSDEG